PVEPLFNKDIFKEHLSDKMNINPDLVEKIIENFKKLNEEISKDPDLGEGFKIGHSYFCEENLNEEKYESIIRYEIAPLLREYWFDKEKIDIQKKIDIVKLN
ncbi:MAG: hypothetical protein LBU40_03980, partial [Methanobrevibacter sp.]|nr:hypothetical protein [Methanobrevibacter sp.]